LASNRAIGKHLSAKGILTPGQRKLVPSLNSRYGKSACNSCAVYMFDRANFLAILAGAAGGGIAIASMEAFSITTAFPLVAIPFATSIVTVLGSPKAEPAQPRALIGGHLVSTLVGLLVVKLFGPNPWPAAMPLA
jgi:CBS-domain-containing membrane protein